MTQTRCFSLKLCWSGFRCGPKTQNDCQNRMLGYYSLRFGWIGQKYVAWVRNKKKSRNSTSPWLTGAINCRHKPSCSVQNNDWTVNTNNFYACTDCFLESSKLNAILSQAEYETLALGCKSRSKVLVDILVSDVFLFFFFLTPKIQYQMGRACCVL